MVTEKFSKLNVFEHIISTEIIWFLGGPLATARGGLLIRVINSGG